MHQGIRLAIKTLFCLQKFPLYEPRLNLNIPKVQINNNNFIFAIYIYLYSIYYILYIIGHKERKDKEDRVRKCMYISKWGWRVQGLVREGARPGEGGCKAW